MNTTSLFPRWVEPRINEAMLDMPVVLVEGPRQAGKTTLVRQVASKGLRYLTLDDVLTLLTARKDTEGFISSLDRAVIDEIQRAPQLLLAIKKRVDQDRRPEPSSPKANKRCPRSKTLIAATPSAFSA